MNISEMFGIDARIEDAGLIIPQPRFLEVGLETIVTASGEQVLAGLILLAYENYFKNNELETQAVRLTRTILAPVQIGEVEKIEYGFTFTFAKPFDDPIFDPDEI